ncbi:hypothetical protein B296_00019563 [Ensete ventricosum]|uniref:Uncharacterized protein n=1 Tax=Ensete ventricosum TaxID=4639 RepID=A0A426YGX6_ENSVE|nr:hypothetical protein B296_00019563 [Ensete ventricosum]
MYRDPNPPDNGEAEGQGSHAKCTLETSPNEVFVTPLVNNRCSSSSSSKYRVFYKLHTQACYPICYQGGATEEAAAAQPQVRISSSSLLPPWMLSHLNG